MRSFKPGERLSVAEIELIVTMTPQHGNRKRLVEILDLFINRDWSVKDIADDYKLSIKSIQNLIRRERGIKMALTVNQVIAALGSGETDIRWSDRTKTLTITVELQNADGLDSMMSYRATGETFQDTLTALAEKMTANIRAIGGRLNGKPI